MYAVICRQCRGPAGRAQPNAADLDRAGPSRTDCASSDGTSVFAVAPASCDTHFKRGGKCRPCVRVFRTVPEQRRSALRCSAGSECMLQMPMGFKSANSTGMTHPWLKGRSGRRPKQRGCDVTTALNSAQMGADGQTAARMTSLLPVGAWACHSWCHFLGENRRGSQSES
ncbi:aldehyde dehydrogenase (NAD+) [Sarotherodon galilaeus]